MGEIGSAADVGHRVAEGIEGVGFVHGGAASAVVVAEAGGAGAHGDAGHGICERGDVGVVRVRSARVGDVGEALVAVVGEGTGAEGLSGVVVVGLVAEESAEEATEYGLCDKVILRRGEIL